jgi:hypothetical protein
MPLSIDRWRRKTPFVFAGLLAFTVVIGACGDDDSDASSSTTTTSTTPSSAPLTSADEFTEYLGLTEADAQAQAESDGLPSRVVEREGEELPVTLDFNPDRLNFVIEDGVVVQVTTG